MTIDELMSDYRKQAGICAQIDYENKASVRANNKAVKRMYAIVEKLKSEFGDEGIDSFTELSHVEENNTNLWVAIHLLERGPLNPPKRNLAIKIIESAAEDNLGLQMWLKDFNSRQA